MKKNKYFAGLIAGISIISVNRIAAVPFLPNFIQDVAASFLIGGMSKFLEVNSGTNEALVYGFRVSTSALNCGIVISDGIVRLANERAENPLILYPACAIANLVGRLSIELLLQKQ